MKTTMNMTDIRIDRDWFVAPAVRADIVMPRKSLAVS